MSRREDSRDALLWLVAALLVLTLVPVGWVSPDGLGAARRASGAGWTPNPNHLLFEPANALWLRLTHRLAPDTEPVD